MSVNFKDFVVETRFVVAICSETCATFFGGGGGGLPMTLPVIIADQNVAPAITPYINLDDPTHSLHTHISTFRLFIIYMIDEASVESLMTLDANQIKMVNKNGPR